jgi:hypothetical protein
MSAPKLAVAWTNNCRGRGDYGLYIMHGYLSGDRTLCGAQIQEIGHSVNDEYRIDCKKCRNIQRKTQPHE